MNKKKFTKKNLLILVISILLTLLFWGAWKTLSEKREKYRKADCAGNLKTIALCSKMYSQFYDGYFPPDLILLSQENYIEYFGTWVCPSTKTKPAKNLQELQRGGHIDYQYFGNGINTNDKNSNKIIIACDKPKNHKDYFNVCFADGHTNGYHGNSIDEIAKINGLILSRKELKPDSTKPKP